ncbi:MAG: D-alanyl-D-alanine carboxypeptidase/D-alanyl-D-alanine-endopeptidase [Actinomycetota bacterium]
MGDVPIRDDDDEAPGTTSRADGVHPFDAASGDADAGVAPADAGSATDGSGGNAIIPPEGRIEIVAEPVRYRRGPIYALVVVAIVPALALLTLHRWADERADAYDAELEELEAERGATHSAGETSVSTTTSAIAGPGGSVSTTAPTLGTIDSSAGGATTSSVPSDEEPFGAAAAGPATALLDYRRTPTAIAGLANARALATALSDFSDRLPFGVCFAASLDGRRVAAHGSSVPLIPASNQKLLTAAAALDLLGPDHVFETSIALPPIVDGVIEGDIYLVGGGDPLLTSADYPIEDDRYPAFHTTSFDALADAVVAAGVLRIRGAVIGDGTRYDDEFTVDSWASGIAGVDAGPYDALLANDARVRGRSSRESDPNAGAAREFVRLLGNRGIQVDNGWGSGSRSTLVPIAGTVTSAPLSDIVEEMLVNSDNNTAEMLVKEIGLATRGDGTRAAGLDAMRQWLVDQGIATLGIELADGSGLSNGNRLTCEAVVAILEEMEGDQFAAALPIAGRTATLAEELEESPVAGRLRAKTGTLNEGSVEPPAVKSLSGYLPDDSGTIQFALIANSPGIAQESAYQALWEALGERLATHPSGPELAELGPIRAEPDDRAAR